MTHNEALEWLNGERSTTDQFIGEFNSPVIAQADAAMMQQAYLVAKARSEGLTEPAYRLGSVPHDRHDGRTLSIRENLETGGVQLYQEGEWEEMLPEYINLVTWNKENGR